MLQMTGESSGRAYSVRSARKSSVLFVDDDEDQCLLFSSLLGALGYQVSVASKADAALGAVQASCFDVIVCDLRMPGMNGFEFIEKVRGRDDKRAANTPIIMLTACSNDLEQAAIEVGADLFCEKKRALTLLPKQIRYLLS